MFIRQSVRQHTATFRFLLLAVSLFFGNVAMADSEYRLQPGDIVEVSVWKEQDLQRDLLVSPDGRVSFPLVGHLQAAGKTVEALNQEFIRKLAVYIPEPSVTVLLKDTAGSRFFVIGKVNRPGQYPMNQPVTVLQALSMAGGTTTYAKTEDIKVVRSADTQSAIPFNYDDIKDGEKLTQNIRLQSGDVVVVP